MPLKRKLQVSVDLLMLILLPLLMAYSLIGEAAHEWLGMAMLVLFVAHHILNRQWIRNLFRGKYTPARIFGTILNFLLAVTMIAMPVSGIIMGNHAVPWLHLSSGTALAREVHLPAAYWGYLLLGLDSDTFYIYHVAAVMVDNLRRLLLGINLSDKAIMDFDFPGVGFPV